MKNSFANFVAVGVIAYIWLLLSKLVIWSVIALYSLSAFPFLIGFIVLLFAVIALGMTPDAPTLPKRR